MHRVHLRIAGRPSRLQNSLRFLILWMITGMLYYTGEGIWRIGNGGWANIVMLPIGGLCGVLVGSLHKIPRFYSMRVITQALLGTCIVLTIELLTGIVLNRWLGLQIWDYTGQPGNIMGQICLPYGVLWFAIMPFTIWLEDRLRWSLWREGSPYSLGDIYKKLWTGGRL